ncbi:MAG: hypothetical protein ACK4UN_14765, partial [Limisphaerales bacterium]
MKNLAAEGIRREATLESVHIRPAKPEDAKQGAELIYLPMGHLADYLFGPCESVEAKRVIEKLFPNKMNRFSYQFAEIAEIDSTVAGMVLAYPAQILSTLAVPMG